MPKGIYTQAMPSLYHWHHTDQVYAWLRWLVNGILSTVIVSCVLYAFLKENKCLLLGVGIHKNRKKRFFRYKHENMTVCFSSNHPITLKMLMIKYCTQRYVHECTVNIQQQMLLSQVPVFSFVCLLLGILQVTEYVQGCNWATHIILLLVYILQITSTFMKRLWVLPISLLEVDDHTTTGWQSSCWQFVTRFLHEREDISLWKMTHMDVPPSERWPIWTFTPSERWPLWKLLPLKDGTYGSYSLWKMTNMEVTPPERWPIWKLLPMKDGP